MNNHKNIVKKDVLIIGCGIAGCSAAITLSEKPLSIGIISLGGVTTSNSVLAQGGIVYKCEGDTFLLMKDIILASHYSSNLNSVKQLANFGPKIIEKILLEKLRVHFDKKGEVFDLAREGAHSCRRILHVKDYTGKVIMDAFLKIISKNKNISMFPYHSLIKLITVENNGRKECIGTYVLDVKTNEIKIFLAKKVILATGGIGQVYIHTVNSEVCRGDGIFAAYDAGANLKDMSYVQFHPTAFYTENPKDTFLITEALRGEGAELKNRFGEKFMLKYHPLGSLAPRDVVSKSIMEEMKKTNSAYVFLDASSLPSVKLIKRFPQIYKKCLERGIDITKDPIPVIPTAHFLCGGIQVDNYGRTNIHNLYAIGECSNTGIHGRNRLASTSLLEGLVWSYMSAKDILQNVKETSIVSKNLSGVIEYLETWEGKEIYKNEEKIKSIETSIKKLMWENVGTIKTKEKLRMAIKKLEKLKREVNNIYFNYKLNNEIIGIKSMVEVAMIIAEDVLMKIRLKDFFEVY